MFTIPVKYFHVPIVIICVVNFVAGEHRPLMGPTKDQNSPEINISSWFFHDDVYDGRDGLENGTYPDDIYKKDDDTYVILDNIYVVTFSCNASYPIQWVGDEEDDMSFALAAHNRRGQNYRTAENVSDPSTFHYRSDLTFITESSLSGGYYKCQSVEQPTVKFHRIFIFFEGLRQHCFPETEIDYIATVGVNENKNVVLPCYTNIPNISVILLKRLVEADPGLNIFEEYILINDSIPEMIHFDPKEGFTINVPIFLTTYDSILGLYKCAANDSSEEHLLVNVVEEHNPHNGGSIVEYSHDNASFSLSNNPNDPQVHCCSASGNLPVLLPMICIEPMICQMSLKSGFWNFNLSEVYAYRNMISYGGMINGSCVSTHVYPSETVIFGCFGDGIVVMRTLYSSPFQLNATLNIYVGWDEVVPEEMIRVTVDLSNQRHWKYLSDGIHHDEFLDVEENTTIYSGQIIRASCELSKAYFSYGARWEIRWKNGTRTALTNMKYGLYLLESEYGYAYYDDPGSAVINFTVSMDIDSVVCLGPVWNSSKWIEKNVPLNITQAKLSPLKCSVSSSQYWALGSTDMGFECEVKGVPIPILTLMKDGKVLNSTIGYEVTVESKEDDQRLMRLKVSTVFHDAQGTYSIAAENFDQKVGVTVLIFVYEPVNWTIIVITAMTIVIGILGISGMIWKMRRQKLILANLNVSYINKIQTEG